MNLRFVGYCGVFGALFWVPVAGIFAKANGVDFDQPLPGIAIAASLIGMELLALAGAAAFHLDDRRKAWASLERGGGA